MSRNVEREWVDMEDLEVLLAELKPTLREDQYHLLGLAVETLQFVSDALRDEQITAARLRRMLFGSSTERTDKILGEEKDEQKDQAESEGASGDEDAPDRDETSGSELDGSANPDQEDGAQRDEKKKKKGNGRNSVDAYTGARHECVPHDTLKRGDRCPSCGKGKVYPIPPERLLCIRGDPPLNATVYEVERLRCNACNKIFKATAPEGTNRKYDETASSMIVLLRYGSGFPFYRLEGLQRNLGIPLADATQWEVIEPVGLALLDLHLEFIRQAAHGDFHNDDTGMRILSLMKERKEREAAGDPLDRTGIFTTGIVSKLDNDRKIVLFMTGRQHAGENLAELLLDRDAALDAPIQMCDALDRNLPKEHHTLVANCLAHARRKFIDAFDSFPDEVAHLLRELRKVYHVDAQARDKGLSPEERLALHQEHSAPILDELHVWFEEKFEKKRVEPNGRLGKAIRYMLKRWDRFTLFLRKPGVPLDNNICERALKRCVLHRKNSLFYMTEGGAMIGDIFMSIIATCEAAKVNPFVYLNEVQRNIRLVNQAPADWMPWNFHESLDIPQPTLART